MNELKEFSSMCRDGRVRPSTIKGRAFRSDPAAEPVLYRLKKLCSVARKRPDGDLNLQLGTVMMARPIFRGIRPSVVGQTDRRLSNLA